VIAEQLGPPRNHDLGWLSGNQQHGIAKNQVLEFFAWGARVRVCASGNLFASECVRFLDLVRRQGHFDLGKRIMVAFSLLMHALEQGGICPVSLFCQPDAGHSRRQLAPPMLPLIVELECELEQIVSNTRSQVNAILDEVAG